MIEQKGDIWEFYHEVRWIVITTNIGWKKDGSNPMGAGIAKQAADMFPGLPQWYGDRCKKYKSDTAVAAYNQARFFLFPTKPLNEEKPWMSWNNDADMHLIMRSVKQLSAIVDILSNRGRFFTKIGLPMVGCSNGRLNPNHVLPILRNGLDDRFVLFQR